MSTSTPALNFLGTLAPKGSAALSVAQTPFYFWSGIATSATVTQTTPSTASPTPMTLATTGRSSTTPFVPGSYTATQTGYIQPMVWAPEPTPHASVSTSAVVGGVVGCLAVIIIVTSFCLFRRHHRRTHLGQRDGQTAPKKTWTWASAKAKWSAYKNASASSKDLALVPQRPDSAPATSWRRGSELVNPHPSQHGRNITSHSLGVSPHFNLISREDAARQQHAARAYSRERNAWIGYQHFPMHRQRSGRTPSLDPMVGIDGQRLASAWSSDDSEDTTKARKAKRGMKKPALLHHKTWNNGPKPPARGIFHGKLEQPLEETPSESRERLVKPAMASHNDIAAVGPIALLRIQKVAKGRSNEGH